MFRLHDKTRRRVCLAAFFGLCVIPTVVVLACGAARHLPGHVQAERKRLAWQLGQDVSLRRVRHVRPGVVVYEGLDLSDPETGNRILRCRTLEAGWRTRTSTHQQGQSRRSLVLVATQAEIEAAELNHVWRLVQGILACRGACSHSDVRLAADELVLRRGETSHRLTELRGRLERLSGVSRADASFRLAELDTPEPVQIRIARNHQAEPPATGLGIHTGGGALPCSLLALGLSELEALGPQSRFRGTIWANEAPEGWSGELLGEFIDVDLEGLVTRHFPHTLRGTAQVTIQGARFRRGRLDEATGSLLAGPGAISRSLVDAAADRMGMIAGLEPNSPGQLLPYDQLGLAFSIDPRGLQLRGLCPAGSPGTILTGRRAPLLGEPVSQPVPVAALLETLMPAREVQVPATPQIDWLIRRLPVFQAIAGRP